MSALTAHMPFAYLPATHAWPLMYDGICVAVIFHRRDCGSAQDRQVFGHYAASLS